MEWRAFPAMTNNPAGVESAQYESKSSRISIIWIFAVLVAGNFFRIGYQLVVVAWSAVKATGRADAVGMILLISTVASLVLSPLLGAAVDFVSKKKAILIFGHFGIALAGGIPLLAATARPGGATIFWIAATVVLVSASSILAGGAMDFFLKSYLPQSDRPRHLAVLNSTAQIALIVGTASGGAVVSVTDYHHALAGVSLCGVLMTALSWGLLPTLHIANHGSRSPRRRGVFSAGPMLYLKHRRLFAIASCGALVFSIGQITNTLLPGLIGVHLHGSSVNYSMIEAAWSAGALLVGLWLARFATASITSIRTDAALIGCMAGVLAAVPSVSDFPALLLLHFALGAGFALVRVRSETRFLAECPMHLLGRFRANSMFMTSSVGLVIFATPSLWPAASVGNLYMMMAGAVALFVFGLLVAVLEGGDFPPHHSANKSGPNTSQ